MPDNRPAGFPPATPEAFRAAMLADVPETYTASAPQLARPSAPCLISAEDRTLDELRDARNRLSDDLDHLSRIGTRGCDVPQVGGLPVPVQPADPLAMLRDVPELPAIRMARRTLGADYAPPRPVVVDLADMLPPPADIVSRPERGLWSPRDFVRQHYPSGDWTQVRTEPADGVEHCGWCARQVARGRKVATLTHEANDLVLRTCLPCATGLQDRPLGQDEHPEARRLSSYSDDITLTRLRDARLWKFSAARNFGVIYLGECMEVAVLRLPGGDFEVTLTTPDNYDSPEILGTFPTLDIVQAKALEAIMAWQAKG